MHLNPLGRIPIGQRLATRNHPTPWTFPSPSFRSSHFPKISSSFDKDRTYMQHGIEKPKQQKTPYLDGMVRKPPDGFYYFGYASFISSADFLSRTYAYVYAYAVLTIGSEFPRVVLFFFIEFLFGYLHLIRIVLTTIYLSNQAWFFFSWLFFFGYFCAFFFLTIVPRDRSWS